MLKNHKLNLNLVKDIFEENKTDPKGQDHSNMGGWHSKTDLEIKYKSFSVIPKTIKTQPINVPKIEKNRIFFLPYLSDKVPSSGAPKN